MLFTEPFNAKYHVFISAIWGITYPLGGILLGSIAMYVHDFRHLMLIIYTPGLFIFVYIWLLPESVRWLLAKGQTARALETLQLIAKWNGRSLSKQTINRLESLYSTDTKKSIGTLQSLAMVLKSKKLSIRLICSCIQWMACCFSYFGLNQSSMQIPNTNHYVSFIISMAIEIPCVLLTQPLLQRCYRRTLLGVSLILTAISVISSPFIPDTCTWAVLCCFLVGKASIYMAFNVIYLFTFEQTPTNIRNTIMNTCSMIGRMGSMAAPFVVLVKNR